MALRNLEGSDFAPTHQFIRFGRGIAIDGKAKRIFVANRKAMKLYDIAAIQNVESAFETDQYKTTSTLRLTVRDVETPYFEVTAYLFCGKLRTIASLLTVLREPPVEPKNDPTTWVDPST